VHAGKGAPSPQAAVNVYLMAFGYKDDAGFLLVLDDDQRDKLMKQWKAYLAKMHRGGTPAVKAGVRPRRRSARRIEVDADVRPVWWGGNGHAFSSVGARHAWRFSTHEDGGWQIDTVTPYAWCGGYVTVEAGEGRR
jgi:hypothetical protein